MSSIVINFDRDGTPVTSTGNLAPELCNHDGQTWSSDLGMRCTACGVRLFASPGVLAYRSRATVDAMYQVWQAAGWPHLSVPRFGRIWIADNWTLLQHPLFAHIGGIPVRADKLAAFQEV